MAGYLKPISSAGIMVAPVVVPPFTVQVKDLGSSGLSPDPSKIRERDEPLERRLAAKEQIRQLAQQEQQARKAADSILKMQKECKNGGSGSGTSGKDRFSTARPDLWKCVNTGDGPACLPTSSSRHTVNSTLNNSKNGKNTGLVNQRNTARPCNNPNRRAGSRPFSKLRETDNLSFASTDTQKLLAMLKESEGEIEGLSISSSMKGSSAGSSAESIFQPLKVILSDFSMNPIQNARFGDFVEEKMENIHQRIRHKSLSGLQWSPTNLSKWNASMFRTRRRSRDSLKLSLFLCLANRVIYQFSIDITNI